MKLGKKFLFAGLAIVCVSIVTIIESFTGKIYLQLVGLICGVFTAAQTITDIKEKKNGPA